MPDLYTSEFASHLDWFAAALHDLSQPLTTLECQLFLSDKDIEAPRTALRETVRGALVQSARMRLLVRSMQDRMSLI